MTDRVELKIMADLSVIAKELRERADQLSAMRDAIRGATAPPAAGSGGDTSPDQASSDRPPISWGAKVSSVFRDRVWWIADTIMASQGHPFDPNWLMACMAWESAETFAPDKKNMAGSGATGLIQFMPTTARNLGTTTAKLAEMTAEDQLNYVYKYFVGIIEWKGPITNIEDCYMAILWPNAVGKPASYGLFERAKKPTTYRQNAGLDIDRDGVVTKFEAAAHVREKLDRGMQFAA